MTDWYKCPNCTKPIPHGVQRCPQCKCVLDWRQIPPTVYMLDNVDPPTAQTPFAFTAPPTIATPHLQTGATPIYGGVTCVNCGRQIIPVKGKFGWGWFVLFLLLWILPAIIYVIYYATKRSDVCPVCEKNAYKLGP
jgi:hypothetical protein